MSARSARDWVLLLALSAMWGTAFLFIKLGVATVPPATLAAGRIALGALILYAAVRWRGLVLPPPGRAWAQFGVIALVGNAAPFFLISWGQQTIDSALAGILMAVMPLSTVLLAHFFVAGERMTPWRAIGFSVGFSGIIVLMGPAALAGLHENIAAQLAVLAGAVCYAANSVIARRLIASNFLVASAAVMIVAAVMAVPLALLLDRPWTLTPSTGSLAAIVVARYRAHRAGDHFVFQADCHRRADFHVARQLFVAGGRVIGGGDAIGRTARPHRVRRFVPDSAGDCRQPAGVSCAGAFIAP